MLQSLKLVISDVHLAAGRFFEGKSNPHEEFHFDDELCALLKFFSSDPYLRAPSGEPMDVELFIAGDFLDFLNIPQHGEFEDVVDEELAVWKLDAIFAGHPKVVEALRAFAATPGHTISYLIGNHDAELFFPKVQERIVRAWDPDGAFPSSKVRMIANKDRVRWEGGIEVHHGNQFEAMHALDFERPFLAGSGAGVGILNQPWGSLYVLKIVNRLKWEREYLDRIRPLKLYVLVGLLLDPWFTLRFLALSTFFFLRTRFVYSRKRSSNLRVTADILKQETTVYLDLERQARRLLDQDASLRTVIFGHTHRPMDKAYPDGKQYINTGTWTKMINLDWQRLGQQFCLTFAWIGYETQPGGGVAPRCELRQWVGEQGPHRVFRS